MKYESCKFICMTDICNENFSTYSSVYLTFLPVLSVFSLLCLAVPSESPAPIKYTFVQFENVTV